MKLPKYIKIKPYDDQFPSILQTQLPTIIGTIMPMLPNNHVAETQKKAKIRNYNLYVVFSGFMLSTECVVQGEIQDVLEEMAEYAYKEIVHPSFYGYKKNCEKPAEELALLKAEQAEAREAKKQAKFEKIASELFKK